MNWVQHVRLGVVGTGLMGSNIAKCLSRRGVNIGLYNRTREKAERLASEIGALVYDSPADLARDHDAVIVFVPDDQALLDVAIQVANSSPSSGRKIFINASTVTPIASIVTRRLLESKGVVYAEAPVYGSTDEARECKLLTILACNENHTNEVSRVISLYSTETVFVGEPPKAIALKLALNNIGLSLPALIAESLMILRAWSVDQNMFLEIARKLWFGPLLDRYWPRIIEEKQPRFKLGMAGKDYWYVASALASKGLPAIVSSALYLMYFNAASGGFADKDYPQVVRYYLDHARKAIGEEPR